MRIKIDLSGSDAPKPITEAENSTSNCYPTLPKSNSLTRVAAFNTSSTTKINDETVGIVYGITPILTVFFSENALASASRPLLQPQAQLTCLKVVDKTDATDATINDGAGDGSAAELVLAPRAIIALALVVALSALNL